MASQDSDNEDEFFDCEELDENQLRRSSMTRTASSIHTLGSSSSSSSADRNQQASMRASNVSSYSNSALPASTSSAVEFDPLAPNFVPDSVRRPSGQFSGQLSQTQEERRRHELALDFFTDSLEASFIPSTAQSASTRNHSTQQQSFGSFNGSNKGDSGGYTQPPSASRGLLHSNAAPNSHNASANRSQPNSSTGHPSKPNTSAHGEFSFAALSGMSSSTPSAVASTMFGAPPSSAQSAAPSSHAMASSASSNGKNAAASNSGHGSANGSAMSFHSSFGPSGAFGSSSTSSASSTANEPDELDIEQLKYMVRDLNTGEMVRIDQFDGSRFSLNTFEDSLKQRSASFVEPEPDEVNHAEVQQKKEETGWFARLFKSGTSEDDSSSSKADNAVKVRTHSKSQQELTAARVIQQLAPHIGPIWSMKFSPDGNYLATAGQDSIVRVWVVVGSPAADAPEAASLISGSRSTSGASTPKSVRSNSIGGGGGQPAGSAPNSARGVPVARSHTPSPRQQPTPAPSSHSGFAAAPSATGVSAPNSARGAPSSSRGVAAPSSARGLDGHHHHALPTPPSTPGSNRISPASSVSLNASSMMQLQQSDFLAMQPPEFSQPLSHSSAAAFAAEAAADAQGDGGGGDGNIGVEGDHDDVHRAVAREIPSAQGGRHFIFKTPLRMYAGHKSDVIDLAWSKSNFLLSASMDKTVRLWHVSRPKCLSLYQHSDFVTAVAFHPVEDRLFLSGSFDKKLRVWNIPEHRVVEWALTANMITAATYSPDGQKAVAGLYSGEVIIYNSEGLKYFTQIECKNRHGKDRNGRKVTGVQFSADSKQLLVTTNDSRLRLFDMSDFSMKQKYKGLENSQLQIQASFSEDGKSVICGSDDCNVYMWPTLLPEQSRSFFSLSVKEDTNQSYENFKAHEVVTTVAMFAPSTSQRFAYRSEAEAAAVHHLIVTAGYNGEIKFIENRGAPKSV